MPIILKESVYPDRLDKMLRSQQVISETSLFEKLKTYRRRVKKKQKTVITEYNQKYGVGRFYARGVSFQSFPNWVIGTLSNEEYIGIDICNCGPTIFYELCLCLELHCGFLEQYVNGRDQLLEEYSNRFKVDKKDLKDMVKRMITSYKKTGKDFLNSFSDEMRLPSLLDSYLQNLYSEIQRNRKHIVNDFPMDDFIPNTSKTEQSKISNLIFHFENEKMNILKRELEDRTFEVGCLKYDCIFVKKHPSIYNDKFIPSLEEHLTFKVLKKTVSYKLRLEECKTISLDNLEDGEEDSDITTNREAAEEIKKMYPDEIKSVPSQKNTLYFYNRNTGDWLYNELEIANYILSIENDRLQFYLSGITRIEQTIRVLKQICVDNEWFENIQNTSLGKLKFKNGYYDFEKKEFIKKFNKEIFFPISVKQEFPEPDEETIKKVNKIFFIDPFKNELVGGYMKKSLARALAGDIQAKKFYIALGTTNTGKSLLIRALRRAFGCFVDQINSDYFSTKKQGADSEAGFREFLAQRFTRILLSTEMNMDDSINGVLVKKISGGDELRGRSMRENAVAFLPHNTCLLLANDVPAINPVDEAVKGRVRYIPYHYTFVSTRDQVNENSKLKDESLMEFVETQECANALIHILLRSWCDFKQNGNVEPAEVIEETKEFIQDSSFKEQFLQMFEITNNDDDTLPFSTIRNWARYDAKIQLSDTKIGRLLRTELQLLKKQDKTGKVYYRKVKERGDNQVQEEEED